MVQSDSGALEIIRASKIPGFVTPLYDGRCVCNIPDTVAKLLGARHRHPLENQEIYELGNKIGCENVVFVLLDGFGFRQVEYARAKFGLPSLDNICERAAAYFPITSVFPSTTSSATTSLHTGLTPQEHGILGYSMYLSEIGSIADMLSFTPLFGRRESLFDLGFDPETFIGDKGTTIHQRLKEDEGISSNIYLNKYIVGSGLSKVTNRGAEVIPILTAGDLFSRLRKRLEDGRRTAPSASKNSMFHFAYYASPDTIAHARGPLSEEYAAEVETIFHMIYRELFQKLAKEVSKSTLLLISADHGLSHINQNEIIDLKAHNELLELLKVPPTGDSRCLFLHAKSEGQVPAIENYFEEKLPGKFHLLNSAEALRRGLFGRVEDLGSANKNVSDRIGTLLAVPVEGNAVDNSNIMRREDYVPGRHGGLSENEMLVPLIASRLA